MSSIRNKIIRNAWRIREAKMCGKVKYDKAGAVRAIRAFAHKRGGRAVRDYYCRRCGAYHITSHPMKKVAKRA